MFTFVLTDKDGRDVFKFRAQAVFQFNMTDDYTLSVANYKEPPLPEADAAKASNPKPGRGDPSGETEGS
ncbi:hypothetical protein [Methylobacterium sp. 391_Methyba4]|uniref:hypothetical protein n=1 Tax=Methylobacterium sp. 391_Methyba4 TaxID=3038924 RepID=UPI00241F67CB|nr:hypothetical protein [Methylobacterium sp. 391_Methyba4]WFS07618.1 hypothetical protein P9K36_30435 [Methylobacterium sp. 391_Methyba4]